MQHACLPLQVRCCTSSTKPPCSQAVTTWAFPNLTTASTVSCTNLDDLNFGICETELQNYGRKRWNWSSSKTLSDDKMFEKNQIWVLASFVSLPMVRSVDSSFDIKMGTNISSDNYIYTSYHYKTSKNNLEQLEYHKNSKTTRNRI